jgi:hypothetical protein
MNLELNIYNGFHILLVCTAKYIIPFITGVKGTVPNIPTKRPAGSSIEDPVYKKTKGSYSVANDPKATDVFKSLFTSHQKAHQQNRAHWITYNPFYN